MSAVGPAAADSASAVVQRRSIRRFVAQSIADDTESSRSHASQSQPPAPRLRRIARRTVIVSLLSDSEESSADSEMGSFPSLSDDDNSALSSSSAQSVSEESDSLSGFIVRDGDDANDEQNANQLQAHSLMPNESSLATRRRFASASAHATPQHNDGRARNHNSSPNALVVDWDIGDNDEDNESLSEESIDMVPPAQRARWNRMLSEQYAILRFSSEPHGNSIRLRFSVRGSHFRAYDVVLDLERCCMTCSCIDFRDGALECDVLCKHCCFVIYRILHVEHNGVFCHMPQRFLAPRLCRKVSRAAHVYLERQRNHRFVRRLAVQSPLRSFVPQRSPSVQQQEAPEHNNNNNNNNIAQNSMPFSVLSSSHLAVQSPLRRRRVMHAHARKRARQTLSAHAIDCRMLDAETLLQFGAGLFGVFQALDADIASDAACGVCLERFDKDVPVVRCGTCRQFVHRECIDIWLRRSRAERKCVFCRAVLTYALL